MTAFKWIVVEDIGRNLNAVGYGFRSPILRPTRFPIDTVNQLLNTSGVDRMFQIFNKEDDTLDETLRVQLTRENFRKPFQEIWEEANPGQIFPWDNMVQTLVTEETTKADLASPIFVGTPAAPKPLPSDNSTQIETLSFVSAQPAPTDTTNTNPDAGQKLENLQPQGDGNQPEIKSQIEYREDAQINDYLKSSESQDQNVETQQSENVTDKGSNVEDLLGKLVDAAGNPVALSEGGNPLTAEPQAITSTTQTNEDPQIKITETEQPKNADPALTEAVASTADVSQKANVESVQASPITTETVTSNPEIKNDASPITTETVTVNPEIEDETSVDTKPLQASTDVINTTADPSLSDATPVDVKTEAPKNPSNLAYKKQN
jgi:hypothetical protein